MIGHDPMNQRSRLLMDVGIIARIGTVKSRQDRVLVQNSRGTADPEGFFVSTDRVRPGDTVLPFTDLPTPAWRFCASLKPP